MCFRQAALFIRERKILCSEFETNFNASFMAFQNNPSPTSKLKLDKAKLEFDLFLTESADKKERDIIST